MPCRFQIGEKSPFATLPDTQKDILCCHQQTAKLFGTAFTAPEAAVEPALLISPYGKMRDLCRLHMQSGKLQPDLANKVQHRKWSAGE